MRSYFNISILQKKKMILEDDSYITRQIDEYPFKGVIPESGDEEDDQYGVIYFADVNITINNFEKEKLDINMLKKVQEKMNKQIPLSNLEKGLKIFFFKTIEEGEKGW